MPAFGAARLCFAVLCAKHADRLERLVPGGPGEHQQLALRSVLSGGLSKQCPAGPTGRPGHLPLRPSYGSRTTDSYISEFWLVPTALPQLRTTRLGPEADSPKVSPGQSLTLPN